MSLIYKINKILINSQNVVQANWFLFQEELLRSAVNNYKLKLTTVEPRTSAGGYFQFFCSQMSGTMCVRDANWAKNNL